MERSLDTHIDTSDVILSRKIGAILIKPDAVKAGLSDLIIQKILDSLPESYDILSIDTVEHISEEQIHAVYQNLNNEDIKLEKVIEYIQSGPNILVTIMGDGSIDLIEHLHQVKGRRPTNWSEERILQGRVSDRTIRDLMPLEGDELIFKSVTDRVLDGTFDLAKLSEDEENYLYKNLVHSPDNVAELRAILSLITDDGIDKEQPA